MVSRIISLEVENFKKISAVEIVPGADSCVLVGGKNASGKTSILDAIQCCLAGKASIPEEPLRQGAERGIVRLDLGDMIVERSFLASGASSLKVATKDGAVYGKPQQILDALYNRISFDPLKFLSLEEKDQSKTLVALVGLDTSEIDAESKEIYESRTAVNRLLKEAQADVDRIPAIVGEDQLPDVKPDPADLMNRLNEAMRIRDMYKADDDAIAKLREQDAAAIVRRGEIESDISGHGARYDAMLVSAHTKAAADRDELRVRQQRELEELTLRHAEEIKSFNAKTVDAVCSMEKNQSDQLAALHVKLKSHDDEIAARLRQIEDLQSKARQPYEDIDQLRAALTTANSHCTTWDAVVAKRVKENILRKRQAESDSLTRELDVLAERKRKILADAKYPISGLAVSEDGTVLFEGVPFSQSSRAQQIRTSVAIGIAMNPALRVLLIRDGSLLDDDNLAIVREMADAADAQIWIERVGNKDESAIIIEDGHIAGVEPVVVEAPKKKTRKKSVDVAETTVIAPSELF